MFWVENVLYLFIFIGYEMMLMPVAYVKQLLSVISKSNWKNFIILVPLWLVFGPLICLVIGVIGDTMNFMGVLCDYKLAEEVQRVKVEDEFKKDKVILYNELLDVMRAIMHIYKKREEEEKGRRRKIINNLNKKGKTKSAADFLDQHFLGQDLDN